MQTETAVGRWCFACDVSERYLRATLLSFQPADIKGDREVRSSGSVGRRLTTTSSWSWQSMKNAYLILKIDDDDSAVLWQNTSYIYFIVSYSPKNRPIIHSSNSYIPSLLVLVSLSIKKTKTLSKMAVIIDNTNSGVEVDLPDTFDDNNDNGNNDRDAEAASTSYEDDTFSISSEGGGKSWRFWNSINRMNLSVMLLVVLLLVLTGSLSAKAAKSSNVVDNNMSSMIKAPKASKTPNAKSTKAPACSAGSGPCTTDGDCCAGLFCCGTCVIGC
jgi:hypothetical protein